MTEIQQGDRVEKKSKEKQNGILHVRISNSSREKRKVFHFLDLPE